MLLPNDDLAPKEIALYIKEGMQHPLFMRSPCTHNIASSQKNIDVPGERIHMWIPYWAPTRVDGGLHVAFRFTIETFIHWLRIWIRPFVNEYAGFGSGRAVCSVRPTLMCSVSKCDVAGVSGHRDTPLYLWSGTKSQTILRNYSFDVSINIRCTICSSYYSTMNFYKIKVDFLRW